MAVRGKKNICALHEALRNKVIIPLKTQNDIKIIALQICQFNNAAFGTPRVETATGYGRKTNCDFVL